jgi:hypothetical protein
MWQSSGIGERHEIMKITFKKKLKADTIQDIFTTH